MSEHEDRARAFLRRYEAFDPNGRGQATYPTPAQLAALQRDLAAEFAGAAATEREACAKECERPQMTRGDIGESFVHAGAAVCARRIRARGATPR